MSADRIRRLVRLVVAGSLVAVVGLVILGLAQGESISIEAILFLAIWAGWALYTLLKSDLLNKPIEPLQGENRDEVQ